MIIITKCCSILFRVFKLKEKAINTVIIETITESMICFITYLTSVNKSMKYTLKDVYVSGTLYLFKRINITILNKVNFKGESWKYFLIHTIKG